MAFHFQTFKTRALTAILFVAIMLAGLLYNHWSFLVLFSVIHFGCWIEYQQLIAKIDSNYQQVSSLHRNTIMLLGWSLMLLNTTDAYRIGHITLHAIGWYASFLLTIIFCLNEVVLKKNLQPKVIGYSVFGLLYISLSWSLMIGLRNTVDFTTPTITSAGNTSPDKGWLIPIILIASIWINDTMQYLVGSFIGKTPFSSISPKKTWEGTIGGSLLAIVVVGLVANLTIHLPLATSYTIPTIAAILGTLGDLLESKLKRMANVKDSGQIMPGHGGFLDRFDSLLVATPFVWFFIKFIL